MKNSADQGGCYPYLPWPLASVDNTLLDLQNCSYSTVWKPNSIIALLFIQNIFLLLKGVLPLHSVHSLFFRSPNITQPCPQVFSVNDSIICSGLPFWRHQFNNFRRTAFLMSLIQYGEDSFKFGEQQLVMVNYACGFNQSETGKYFEWIIIKVLVLCIDQIVMNTWDSIDYSSFFYGRMENPEIRIRNRNRNRNRRNKRMVQVGKYDWHQYSSSLVCIPRKMDDNTLRLSLGWCSYYTKHIWFCL